MDDRANQEMYELFYKQYKIKKNKTSEHRIIRHFTEEIDSKIQGTVLTIPFVTEESFPLK